PVTSAGQMNNEVRAVGDTVNDASWPYAVAMAVLAALSAVPALAARTLSRMAATPGRPPAAGRSTDSMSLNVPDREPSPDTTRNSGRPTVIGPPSDARIPAATRPTAALASASVRPTVPMTRVARSSPD